MNNLSALIQQFCPDGVRVYSVRDLAGYSKTRLDSSRLNEDNFVGVDNMLPNKAGKGVAKYSPNTSRLTAYDIGDILIGNIRPYLKKIWLATNSGGASGDVLVIRILPEFRDKLLPEFLYYLLSSDNFFAYNMQHAKGAKMPRGDKSAILNYRMPLPPLKIQIKIVDILNKFRKLEESLETELEVRHKQFDFYLRYLFSDEEMGNAQHLDLEKVATIKHGKDWKNLERGDIPVYGTGGIMNYVNKFTYDKPTVLIPRKGSIENLYYLETPFWNVDTIFYTEVNTELIIPKYLFYYLSTINLKKLDMGSGRPSLTQAILYKISVPVPSLSRQKEIVSILDNFELLISDSLISLPAELNARRVQFEFYRDRLLTFQELAT